MHVLWREMQKKCRIRHLLKESWKGNSLKLQRIRPTACAAKYQLACVCASFVQNFIKIYSSLSNRDYPSFIWLLTRGLISVQIILPLEQTVWISLHSWHHFSTKWCQINRRDVLTITGDNEPFFEIEMKNVSTYHTSHFIAFAWIIYISVWSIVSVGD